MAIIPIDGATKATIINKVEEKRLQIVKHPGVEKPHLYIDKDKWLVVTSKAYKTQAIKEVDRILREMTLKIISLVYNNQPGTITR